MIVKDRSIVARLIRISTSNRWCWRFYEILGAVYRYARRARIRHQGKDLIAEYDAVSSSVDSPASLIGVQSAPLVYDVGMNNGDDVEYYLQKGCRVVGIEANPELCRVCEARFTEVISQGRLKILNCAVGACEGHARFYLSRTNHVLSTLVPAATPGETWTEIPIRVRKLSTLIKEYGYPYFVKIDVEHVDAVVLHDLMEHGIAPPFISAESHEIDVFCHLVAMGYVQFKLVRGASVHSDFRDHKIHTVDGESTRFEFKHHSSGPFGRDIPGPWMGKDEFLDELLAEGLGWVDIHARR